MDAKHKDMIYHKGRLYIKYNEGNLRFVGVDGSVTKNKTDYIEFHCPGEHKIGNKSFDLEMHLVH
jgi:carbonic anhydrase